MLKRMQNAGRTNINLNTPKQQVNSKLYICNVCILHPFEHGSLGQPLLSQGFLGHQEEYNLYDIKNCHNFRGLAEDYLCQSVRSGFLR